MVITRSRASSLTRIQLQPEMSSAAGEQYDGTRPSTSDGRGDFVDVRSSTPPLPGHVLSAGASPPSPPPQHGRESPADYSTMPHHGRAPPVASPLPQMSAPVVMTDQQLVFLLQSLRSPPSLGAPPSPTTTVSTNFANCTARFNGSGDVTSFIDAIGIYKDCVGISDDIALRGLPMLLTDFAATWWQGVKHSIPSWEEALHVLRQTFGPRLPPHRIYREVFSREQAEERTDVFVCRVRALLAQLPPCTLPENPVQLDMVYGLLHKRIRERVARNTFTSFSELLQHARVVEDILEEVHTPMTAKKNASTPAAPPPPVTGSTPSTTAGSSSAPKVYNTPHTSRSRPRCSFCKFYGHTIDDCRKFNKRPAEHVKSEPVSEPEQRPSIACFGCGTPGVIRSKCMVCKENRSAQPATSTAFQSVSAVDLCESAFDPRVRPILSVEVFGAIGTALIDTGAKQSVASVSLTQHLRRNGQVFERIDTELKFADGTKRVQNIETALVNVKVQGVTVVTRFIVLPGATESLLGMNFIRDAGMVLDFERNRYYLRSSEFYDLQYERSDRAVVSSAIGLRECEGTLLSPAEKGKLAALLDHNADIFSAGGGPTPFAVHRIDTGNAVPISTPPYRVTSVKDLCQKFKPTNLKPAGLLQTPVPQQRFEVLAMDLFGPLPEGSKGERWIFLIEDTASRWVELFPLAEANAENCAKILIEEVFLRYGFPRRVISDNGTQFVSAVMQKAMHVLGITQNLTPVYHPECNPAERKNREMKQMLAILIDPEHRRWPEVLPAVRFALNTAPNQGTGRSAAFLTFARQFRSPVDVAHDLRVVVDQENYVPQITPYLRNFAQHLQEMKWRVESQQDIRKDATDKSRRDGPRYQEGDLVLVESHRLSQASKGFTTKFAPRREGPYRVHKVVSPTTYEVVDKEGAPRGKYHASALTPYVGASGTILHSRKKGRPRKNPKPVPESSTGLEGEDIAQPRAPLSNVTPRPSRLRRPPARLSAFVRAG